MTTTQQSALLLQDHYQRADRLMWLLLLFMFIASLALAFWHNTWPSALTVGTATLVIMWLLTRLSPGSALTRAAMGASFMVFSALHIHQAQGMIEFHFGIFAFMAALLYYRDWLPIVSAALTIAAHHLIFYHFQHHGADVWVTPHADTGWWVIFVHAGYVVIEAAILIWIASNARKEAWQGVELVDFVKNATADDQIDLGLRTSGKGGALQPFNQFVDALEQLVTATGSISRDIQHHGENLSDINNRINDDLTGQTGEIHNIASATEELSGTATGLAGSARSSAETVQQVAQESNRARHTSELNASAMGELSDKMQAAAKVIGELNHQSGEIDRVLEVIRAVAEQTNLLALNAAIEAARAGEQGRGFAVVADEVRSLARKTQESTVEIDGIIRDLQKSSGQAVDAIEGSRVQLSTCLENNQHILEVIRTTEAAADTLRTLSQGMVSATDEQGQAAAQINQTIVRVLDAAQSSVDLSQEATRSGESLKALSAQMRKQLETFK